MSLIIAVDGPAASGKGTIAARLARTYGLPHLDTGLLYRAVGVRLLEAGRSLDDEAAATEAARSLDVAARSLTAPDGRVAPLSGADFDLLHALVRNGGRPLSRERIRALSTVADADDRAVDLRVSRLRQKLGDDAKNPVLIRTVRSLGYMLSGPVTWRA